MAQIVSQLLRGWEKLSVGDSMAVPGIPLRGSVQIGVNNLNKSFRGKYLYKFTPVEGGSKITRLR